MKKEFKSVCPVLNKTGWVARARTMDGREVFVGIGAGYTLAQAGMLCDSLTRDAYHHGVDAALA